MGVERVRRERGGQEPTVQVGDPFTENPARGVSELMKSDWIVGIQDMGAAGPDLLDLRDGEPRGRGSVSTSTRSRAVKPA